MAAPKKNTQLAVVHKTACEVALQMLKGEPLLDKEGNLVLFEGKPLMKPCSAAAFREVRELLKDHGIDEEPTEGSSILKVADAAKKYEDADDPFLVPDTLKRGKPNEQVS